MKLDESHALNRLVLERLGDPKRVRFDPRPIASPREHPDPYQEAGSHPDVVERVWDVLGASLPKNGRALVYGAPALVHPLGVVMALAYGTQYALRIPEASLAWAAKAGCKTEQTWTGGGMTNIEDELGRGWVFGAWLEQEKAWLAQTYADLG